MIYERQRGPLGFDRPGRHRWGSVPTSSRSVGGPPYSHTHHDVRRGRALSGPSRCGVTASRRYATQRRRSDVGRLPAWIGGHGASTVMLSPRLLSPPLAPAARGAPPGDPRAPSILGLPGRWGGERFFLGPRSAAPSHAPRNQKSKKIARTPLSGVVRLAPGVAARSILPDAYEADTLSGRNVKACSQVGEEVDSPLPCGRTLLLYRGCPLSAQCLCGFREGGRGQVSAREAKSAKRGWQGWQGCVADLRESRLRKMVAGLLATPRDWTTTDDAPPA